MILKELTPQQSLKEIFAFTTLDVIYNESQHMPKVTAI